MKLTLTLSELKAKCGNLSNLVRGTLGIPDECEVEVVEDEDKAVIDPRALPVFRDMAYATYSQKGRFCFKDSPNSKYINQIAAIKELRTVIPGLGLAEAKEIVMKFYDLL